MKPAPEISIVVVTYRDASLLRDCLHSIARTNADGLAVEVLVVVNGHQVQWAAGLPYLDGRVRYLHAGANLGFAGACNLAARHARGQYLALLNDDALVEPGWLSSLVASLERHPEAAAAGSLMIDTNGRIWEAGCVVWADGSTLGVGRGLPGSSLRWDFVRTVDYCSAASLLVRRHAWEAVGGMDEGYHPAYAEDVDLCLRLRTLGMTVLFEPRSRIIHRVSQSSGARYREFIGERGRRRLAERWRDELAARLPAPTEYTLDSSMEQAVQLASGAACRVVVVDDRVPDQSLGSGFGRMVEVLAELATIGFGVTFHATVEPPRTLDTLRDIGCRVLDTSLDEHLASAGVHYDVALVSRPVNHERAVAALRQHQPQAHIVYDAEALWHRRIERQAALAIEPGRRAELNREATAMRELETRVVRDVDSVVCISDEEAAVIAGIEGHAPVRVVDPTPVMVRPTPAAFEQRQDMVFVAGWLAGRGSPNEDALSWFVTEVLPMVVREVPSARLLVTGAGAPLSVRMRRGASVRLLGYVPDLWGLYDSVRVAVSPTRFGSGVKIKTVEALAHGVPVISTTVGAEGVDAAGLPILEPTDDPAALAMQAVVLLSDSDKWRDRRAAIERWLSLRATHQAGDRWAAVIGAAADAGRRPAKLPVELASR